MTTINLTEDSTTCISTNIVSETSSNLDTCTVEVPFNYTISIGDELNVYDKDSVLKFKGLVQNIKISGRKEVVAYDYGVQLMDININDIYTSQKAEDIIEDIVNKTDLTYVSTITTSLAITTFLVKDKIGWDVINELAELLNASFRVDKNKNFYLELIEEDMSTETITTENAVIDDDWNQDADQLINKITVIGDKQLFEKTETFDGDGTTTTFTLAEFPVDTNVEVGGTEQTGYVEGATTAADYSVTKGTKNIIFTTGSIPGVGTGNVVVRYTFAIDIKLVSQDDASITSYGGPNKIAKEKKIVKPYITSFQEARNFANFYLGIYAQPLLTSTWIINDYTLFENFVPNQKINVVDSIRGINDTFIIKKVEREFPGQLKVEIGWPEDDILDWNKEVQYRIKQLEEIDNNSTILQEYGFIENKVQLQVTTSVERELYRNLPDNYMYFADEISSLIGWWKGNGDVLDYSGNNNSGTWNGTETYATGKQFDEAFDLNGSSYIDLGSNSTIYSLSEIFYISGWVNIDSLAAQRTFFTVWGGSDADQMFIVRINTNGTIRIDYQGSSSQTTKTSTVTMTAGSYQLLEIIFDNDTLTIGVNGIDDVIDITGNRLSSGSSSSDIWIGRYSSTYMLGNIGDIRIYDTAPTSDERISIYNSGLGLTSNANINEIGAGEDRPLKDATEIPEATAYYITDKNYWANPDYEITNMGDLQSWGFLTLQYLTTESGDTITTESGDKITLD